MSNDHDRMLKKTLNALRVSLPPGSVFSFDVCEGEVTLKLLRVRQTGVGSGTRFLAAVLSRTDAANCPVKLIADPTDEPADPELADLVRWYSRFGFQPVRATDDGVWMERAVRSPAPTAETLAEEAVQARANDAPRAEFDAWLEAARAKSGASPSWNRASRRTRPR